MDETAALEVKVEALIQAVAELEAKLAEKADQPKEPDVADRNRPAERAKRAASPRNYIR